MSSKALKYFVILNLVCLLLNFGLVIIKSQRDAAKADMMQQSLDLIKDVLERRQSR